MSRSRDLYQHIHQLEDIRGILNAMKNLALMAVHKLTQLQLLQSQIVAHVERNSARFLAAYPHFVSDDNGQIVYLVLGSERGFCGDFNEKLLDSLKNKPYAGIIAVGNRLIARAEAYDYRLIARLTGMNVVEDVPLLLEQLMQCLNNLDADCTLMAVYHDLHSNQIQHRQILPLPRPPKTEEEAPLLNVSPELFFVKMLEQVLLPILHEIIYLSSLAENRRRLQHLEGAVQHLDAQTQKLHHKSQIYRQEEITEELEVILLNAE